MSVHNALKNLKMYQIRGNNFLKAKSNKKFQWKSFPKFTLLIYTMGRIVHIKCFNGTFSRKKYVPMSQQRNAFKEIFCRQLLNVWALYLKKFDVHSFSISFKAYHLFFSKYPCTSIINR